MASELQGRNPLVFDTMVKKKRAVGLVLFVLLLALFLAFNRFPKLDTVRDDLQAVTAPQVECFQGFCIEKETESTFLSRSWDFSLTYLRLVTVGMTFAFLAAGLTEAFLFPQDSARGFSNRGIKGSLKGLFVGAPLTLCSACIVPISSAFRRKGASVEATLGMVLGSSTLNIPALIMVAMIFTPLLGGSRFVLSIVAALLIGPLVAVVMREQKQVSIAANAPIESSVQNSLPWKQALTEGFRDWIRSTLAYVIRLGPIMVLAGFASALAIQWISVDTVTTYLGNHFWGIAIAATFGILINVPLLFEIPLVVLLLLLGMGEAPAATLLFTAAAGGPITFWGLAKLMPKKAISTFATATWSVGVIGGLSVLALGSLIPGADFGSKASVAALGTEESSKRASLKLAPESSAGGSLGTNETSQTVTDSQPEPLRPFNRFEIMPLKTFSAVTPFSQLELPSSEGPADIWNYRPGVVVFDYDRDGDLDFYVTSEKGRANVLYRNDGGGNFKDVAKEAGVEVIDQNSTGIVACDFNNDGYQELYVGAQGTIGDMLDFRSPSDEQGNKDALFLNNGNGTFTDISDSAFGVAINLRSATSVSCGDLDGDGWLDLYVGNLADEDFRRFDRPEHSGHYNVLYMNNGDLTFSDVTELAGVRGPEILMRYPDGTAVLYQDPKTGQRYEGYDPTIIDKLGNQAGEPTGQTHAVILFDSDDDGDPDLWVANDGDRLHYYRNDSTPGNISFTPVAQAMGINKVGAWMGFALGDSDGDSDLDLFITNMGFHSRLKPPPTTPRGDCAYHDRFQWGTCLHFLLRNDGVREIPGLGTVGQFTDVASATGVEPSPIMPPESLNLASIHPEQVAPTGLAAYDFGFGTTFFDYDNDGDQDLYWLGSTGGPGEGPGGNLFPAAGRMLLGDGGGDFEDITVRSRLLDILWVNYSVLDSTDSSFDPVAQRMTPKLHENGKGLAHGDLNGDGYVDLIGTNSKGAKFIAPPDDTEEFPGPLFVWINGGGENHWLALRLRGRMAIDGTGSNADGIGARVYVTTKPKGAEKPLVQVQQVIAGSSYLSMDSIDLEFGLGTIDVVQQIEVLWPSGRQQILTDVPANQVLLVEEPSA